MHTTLIIAVVIVNTSSSPSLYTSSNSFMNNLLKALCEKMWMSQCPCRDDLQRAFFIQKWSSCPFCWKTHVHACCNPLTCSERTSRDTAVRNTLHTLISFCTYERSKIFSVLQYKTQTHSRYMTKDVLMNICVMSWRSRRRVRARCGIIRLRQCIHSSLPSSIDQRRNLSSLTFDSFYRSLPV